MDWSIASVHREDDRARILLLEFSEADKRPVYDVGLGLARVRSANSLEAWLRPKGFILAIVEQHIGITQ